MSRAVKLMVAVGFSVVCLLVFVGPSGLALQRQRFLVHAAARGDTTVLRMLLALGADPNSELTAGSSLYAAVWYGHLDAAELLLSHGADVDAVDRSGFTPLMAAASRGDDPAVRFLLEKGAQVSQVSRCGNALDMAIAGGHRSTAVMLTEAGARPTPR
jgi:ankyrin repeat protein